MQPELKQLHLKYKQQIFRITTNLIQNQGMRGIELRGKKSLKNLNNK